MQGGSNQEPKNAEGKQLGAEKCRGEATWSRNGKGQEGYVRKKGYRLSRNQFIVLGIAK